MSDLKNNWKNKLWYGSKISQYKMEKALKCFADGKTTKQTSTETKISLTTVKGMFKEFRWVMVHASLNYRYLFNGAGMVLMFGYPPFADEVAFKANGRRQGGNNDVNMFFYEDLIRRYTSYNYNKEQISMIAILAIAHHTRKYRILLKEFAHFPLELGFRPDDGEYITMDSHALMRSEYGSTATLDYMNDLWKSTYRGEYKIPEYVWVYIDRDRERFDPSETIYRDLRWYLLKHPIRGGKYKPSNYWEDMPNPPADRFKRELEYLFGILRELKTQSV